MTQSPELTLNITDVIFSPAKTSNKGLVGFVHLTINDSLRLNSIAVYRKLNGDYRLLYPTKNKQNSSQAIFHPLTTYFSQYIETAVTAYLKEQSAFLLEWSHVLRT